MNDCGKCPKKNNCQNSPQGGINPSRFFFWQDIYDLCQAALQELNNESPKTDYLTIFKKTLIWCQKEIKKTEPHPAALDLLKEAGYENHPEMLQYDINLLKSGVKRTFIFIKTAKFSEKKKKYLIARINILLAAAKKIIEEMMINSNKI